MVKITKMPVGQVNKIIEELFNRRSKFDSRGRIDTRQVFKAVRASYNADFCNLTEEEALETLRATINFIVYFGYLKFEKTEDGYVRFFLSFKDVIRNEHGKVIGVRW